MKYKVDSCVCDSCIKNEKDEIILIVNSRANALTICDILNFDNNRENGIVAPIVYESQKIKDTAEKILNELKNKSMQKTEKVVDCNEVYNVTYYTISNFGLNELAKQFGVEIKD